MKMGSGKDARHVVPLQGVSDETALAVGNLDQRVSPLGVQLCLDNRELRSTKRGHRPFRLKRRIEHAPAVENYSIYGIVMLREREKLPFETRFIRP